METEVVPWISKEEWIYCRDNLYSNNLQMKQKAVEHLHIWKIRCLNLPVAVECTLILMDIHVKSCQLDDKNQEILFNTMNFQLMFSMAVMRFINLITDSHVGNKPSLSLNQTACELGIPEWIVEIRHTAAHGQSLPSLSELRRAIEFCLQWLFDNYWSIENYVNVENVYFEDAFNYVLHCFEVCLLVKDHLLANAISISDFNISDKEKIRKVFTKKTLSEEESNFYDRKLPHLFRMILKKLSRQIKKNTKNGNLIVDKLLENDFSLQLSNFAEIKQEIKRFNEILIIILNSDSCQYLLQSIVNIVINEFEENRRKKYAAYLLDTIFEKSLIPQTAQKESMDSIKQKKFIKFKKKECKEQKLLASNIKLSNSEKLQLLDLVLKKPNQFTKIFLKNLLSIQEPSIDPLKCSQLLELVDIYTRNTTDGMKHELFPFTLEALLGCKKYNSHFNSHKSDNFEDNTAMIHNQFEKSLDDNLETYDELYDWNWSRTPLGVLPWQTEFKPWLSIYKLDD